MKPSKKKNANVELEENECKKKHTLGSELIRMCKALERNIGKKNIGGVAASEKAPVRLVRKLDN